MASNQRNLTLAEIMQEMADLKERAAGQADSELEQIETSFLNLESMLGRVDKRDSPWAWGMIQAGICDGDQLGTRPYVGRGVGVL